jgi:hypothetical protein
MSALDEQRNRLVAKGKPAVMIVFGQSAYVTLMESARSALRAESFGALVGRTGPAGGQGWTTIEQAVSVQLVASGMGLAPDMRGWEELKKSLQEDKGGAGASGVPERRIVGWFYADPAIGIFEPRIDLRLAGRSLALDGEIFLLANPNTDQGAFYLWRDGHFMPAGGFYEIAPIPGKTSLIPWDGQVRGASKWMGTGEGESQGGD